MADFYKRVKVTFNLPFALDIPNNLYKVKTDDFVCGIHVRVKQAQDNPSGWQGNARIADDRFGHTNYSEIQVEFVLTKPVELSVGKDEEVYEKYSLEAINRLLDNIRRITDEFVNYHLIRKDIPSMSSKFYDKQNQELAGSYFSMKSPIKFGGITSLTKEELKNLINRLENNEKIPFEIELIRNAKDHLKFENYRMAAIEIQNAVEYVIAEIMIKYLKGNGKLDEEIDNILSEGFKRFKDTFKEATSQSITQSSEYSKWQNQCAKLRHLVLHRGKQPVLQEAQDSLNAGLNFLKILESYRNGT